MLSSRAIAIQGFGYGTRLTSVQGLWPYGGAPSDVSGGSAAHGRKRRDWRLEERLDELDRLLREHEARRRHTVEPDARPAAEVLASFRTDQEAAERVARAISRARLGVTMPEAETHALRAVLAAARQRVADAEARRVRNRWRAVVLVALWMLM